MIRKIVFLGANRFVYYNLMASIMIIFDRMYFNEILDLSTLVYIKDKPDAFKELYTKGHSLQSWIQSMYGIFLSCITTNQDLSLVWRRTRKRLELASTYGKKWRAIQLQELYVLSWLHLFEVHQQTLDYECSVDHSLVYELPACWSIVQP